MPKKKHFFILFSLFVFVSCESKLSNQEIVGKLSLKMCECIESAKYKNAGEIQPCYEKLYEEYGDLIREYYSTNELSESQIFEFNNKIAAKTLDTCEYIKHNFPTGIIGEKRTKQKNLHCDDLKNSRFYYITQIPNSTILDTTYVTILKNEYLEKSSYRKTYSRSRIIWKGDCKFNLIFEETNDPFKKELFQIGQIFHYEIIANENESFFLETEWKGKIYQSQMFKMK